ncbi:MAG: peptidylprolyl isomerase [Synechococcus sp. XM-24]|jgi:parvulin-like peptidyl-prolyl isomerase|nr:MAG: peptidylprolyl isomerase [Synechococcus sp. XM-24]
MVERGKEEALTESQIGLLARHRLIRPLLRQMIAAECASTIPVSDEDRKKVLDEFMREQKINSESELNAFLRLNLLQREELQEQLLQSSRLNRYIDEHFRSKAEARFLQRKNDLDRVVYSLLRLEDAGLARELFLRINEGESDFAELAAAHAEGPEKATRGVVGPVPLMQAHPVLAERLRTGIPGVLLEPFQIGKWWLVVRLESFSPATLNLETTLQMTRELFEEAIEELVVQRINQLIPLRFAES